MKRVLIPLAAGAVFITMIGVLIQKTERERILLVGDKDPGTTLAQKQIKVGETRIQAEITDTNEKIRLGMSGRNSLKEGEGMLFVFDDKNILPPFWMKDMRFAIDIIWIDDEKIVQIDENIPPPEPGTDDSQLPLYTPGQPIDYVLEVNSGFIKENGIAVGDDVDLSRVNQ